MGGFPSGAADTKPVHRGGRKLLTGRISCHPGYPLHGVENIERGTPPTGLPDSCLGEGLCRELWQQKTYLQPLFPASSAPRPAVHALQDSLQLQPQPSAGPVPGDIQQLTKKSFHSTVYSAIVTLVARFLIPPEPQSPSPVRPALWSTWL